MSPAIGFLVGQMIGATFLACLLAYLRKWRWVPVPFIGLFLVWAIGYWLATK